jgi:LCP family protein required for cell wall assembly
MGNQFKKPFSMPEEPSKGSLTPAIPEQDTARTPAVNFSSAPHLPSGRFPSFHGAGGAGLFGNTPVSQMGNQPSGGLQGNGQIDTHLSSLQGGMPVHSLFGGMQAPPVTPISGSGTASGPQRMGSISGMGGSVSSRSGEQPASVQGREKSRAGTGTQGKKKRRVPIWAWMVTGFLVFLIVLGSGLFTVYQIYFASAVSSITNKHVVRVKGEIDPNQGKPSDILNWGRINILLLGSDTDEKGVWTGNAFLTQTVIVASIDTATHEVDMLSIPRDFDVNIPGHGMDKLDTAFAYGGSINNNMSGVATVYATLDQDFGIKINYYGWVGLQGFIKVINTVNGVDVNVMHPIVDDTYPDDVTASGGSKKGFGYKRIYIGDGPQHLDGAMALAYVRSRHSTTDFDRSARQQQVLSALRLKIDNASIITQLPQIADDLQGSFSTDLDTTKLLELGNFARGVDSTLLKHLTLSAPKYGRSTTVLVHGQSEDVVEPDCDAIPAAVNAFFHISTAICHITTTSGDQGPVLTSSSGSRSGAVADTSSFAHASCMTDSGQYLDTGLELVSWNDLFGIGDLLTLMSMVMLNSPQV